MGCKSIFDRSNRVDSLKGSGEDFAHISTLADDFGLFRKCPSRILQLTVLILIPCTLFIGHGIANIVVDMKVKGNNSVNPFLNKPWFLRVCSTNLWKTLWEKEKLLVTNNFSFSHSVFYPFVELIFDHFHQI